MLSEWVATASTDFALVTTSPTPSYIPCAESSPYKIGRWFESALLGRVMSSSVAAYLISVFEAYWVPGRLRLRQPHRSGSTSKASQHVRMVGFRGAYLLAFGI